ncbi:THAP domain-containing protein 1-like [Rhipicephalus microplus]|uniref:THAP domain-containing protein 1-like n=1 Tax=Rhipicephalus microplus TaxID=6941 RepID=UPI003F6B22EA
MPGCCAYGCRNRTTDEKKFFSIPRGDDNISRRKIWLHRIGRKDFVPTENTRLGEDHFDVEEFEPLILQSYGQKKLKPYATPSIFTHLNYKTSTFS